MNILFSAIVGSKLYGMDTPESDTDIRGVCLQSISDKLGLNNKEKYENSNGLEGKDKIESIHFCLDKYMKLVLSGNPTILEMAFVPEIYMQHDSELGKKARQFVRNHCISKEVFPAYMGYFHSQLEQLKKRKTEGKRQELIDKYGYDVKFAAHAARIALQAIDLFKTGVIYPKTRGFIDLQTIRNIREGKLKYESVIDLLTVFEGFMKQAKDESTIREKVNVELVNFFLVDIYKEYIKGGHVS